MESKLYAEFRAEGEHGDRLPVAIPCDDGVYVRYYRAASWSSVYAEDHDEMIGCVITCMIYTHRELEDYEPEAPDTTEA
jgi:hypothetical protein